VDVLQPPLAVGGADRRFELVVELALLADGIEDHRAPLLELAQIAQPLLERAQLRIIEPAGRLLAIAGDERHRRSFVEQRRGGGDLRLANAKLLRDPSVNRSCHASTYVYAASYVMCDEEGMHMAAAPVILQVPRRMLIGALTPCCRPREGGDP